MRVNNLTALTLLAILPWMSSGCRHEDAIHTWYIERNGTVTWSIIEKDIWLDAAFRADRYTEVGAFLDAVGRQDIPMARGLEQLAPIAVRTGVVRNMSPYTIVTEARFVGLDALARWVLGRIGLAGLSALTRVGEEREWTLTIQDPRAPGAIGRIDEDLTAVLEGLRGLDVMLADGEFVSAQGFTLAGDRATLALDGETAAAAVDAAAMTVTLKLRWSTIRVPPAHSVAARD